MSTLARRALTIPAVLLSTAVALTTAPLWLPLSFVVDLFRRRRFATLRTALFLTALLCCETAGILMSFALWLVRGQWRGGDRRAYLAANVRLQTWWATAIFGAARRLFGFELEVLGEEAVREPPFLLFPRHTSLADTLLPVILIAGPHGTRLRYVLKRELLLGPCLDIVGHRLPNHFVDRDPDDSESEIAAVGELVRGLARDEIAVIYPEGTRYSAKKRAAVIERLRKRGLVEIAQRAERLKHVLPPRPGGPLAFVENAPLADVVFCAHRGFESAASLADLWSGRVIGAKIRIEFRRVPAERIPEDAEKRRAWLFEEWEEIDAWVERDADPCSVG